MPDRPFEGIAKGSKEVLAAALTAAVCLILTVWVYRTGVRTFFKEPVPLGGDGAATAQFFKMFIESSGTHLFHPLSSGQIGWPYGYQSQYFPTGLWIELSLLRAYSALVPGNDPSVLLKTFAVLRVIPIALGSWTFGRIIRLSHLESLTLSLCFTLSTFNVIRAFGHFGLGMTWTVPMIASILIYGSRLAANEDTTFGCGARLQVAVMTLVMVICGLSGFYFSIFGLILGVVSVTAVVGPRLIELRSKQTEISWNCCVVLLHRLSALLFPLAGLLTGFLTQVVPNIIAQRASPPLVSTASRSWTESIVYSGSPESLTFDLHALILQIVSLPAIVNFLETRATWEARQVGAVAGAAGYLLFIVFVLRIVGVVRQRQPQEAIQSSHFDEVSKIRALLVVALMLYFVGPFNFGLSRSLLPFVRAWGRMAPFITLFLVALLLLTVNRLRRPAIRLLACLAIISVQVLEINVYRETFPDGRALAAAASETRSLREATILDLATHFEQNCSLAQLPVYPFPEYDSPNDSNGDYGLFDLPVVDDYRFQWSYGAIKNTDAARHYAPFVSQQPPFARISLSQQIQYWAALRPCGAVIDRTFLYVNEQQELDAIQTSSQRECFRTLKGEKFKDSARFVMINFTIAACRPRIGALTRQLVDMASHNEILWQPITVGIARFERYWAMIPVGSPHQLMYSVRGSRPALDVRMLVLVLAGTKPFATQPVELCVNDAETRCHELLTNSAGLIELPLTLTARDELHSILSVSITANGDTPLEWGAILLPSATDSPS